MDVEETSTPATLKTLLSIVVCGKNLGMHVYQKDEELV